MKFYGKVILIVVLVIAVIGCFVWSDAYNNKRVANCRAVTNGFVSYYSGTGTGAVDGSKEYSVTATYWVNGVMFECTGKTNKFLQRGGTVEVHYDASNPSLAYCGSRPGSPFGRTMMWIGVAVFFLILSVLGVCFRRSRFGGL